MRKDLYRQMYYQESYYWWHQAKRALVKKYLPKKKLKIIDIGCGTGKLLEELSQTSEAWGIDTNKDAILFCQKRGLKKVIHANFPNTQKIHKKFDVAICLDVAEHIKNDSQLIESIKNLLKKDGILILTVPANKWLYSYWDKILGHKRRYSKQELKSLIITSGFTITKLSFLYSFLMPAVVIFRVIKSILFKNRKPSSDFIDMPKIFHHILLSISRGEQTLLNYFDIPFGLSLVCIARKK